MYFDKRWNWKLKRVVCNNNICEIKSHSSPFSQFKSPFTAVYLYINNNLSLFASITALIWTPSIYQNPINCCQMSHALLLMYASSSNWLIFFPINSRPPLRTKVMYFSLAISMCWTCWGPFLCVMRKIVCKMFQNSLQPCFSFLPSLCICLTKILEKPRASVTNNEIMTPNK